MEPLRWWNCWLKSEEMCGKRLNRPHLTCFTCWIRRMRGGLMPVEFRATEIRLIVWNRRPGWRWKRYLVKWLLSIVEALTR